MAGHALKSFTEFVRAKYANDKKIVPESVRAERMTFGGFSREESPTRDIEIQISAFASTDPKRINSHSVNGQATIEVAASSLRLKSNFAIRRIDTSEIELLVEEGILLGLAPLLISASFITKPEDDLIESMASTTLFFLVLEMFESKKSNPNLRNKILDADRCASFQFPFD